MPIGLPPDALPELTDDDRRRYEWQMWVDGIGETGQRRLKAARVLISRVGGVGGNVALHLAAAGVGTLILAHAGNARPTDPHRQLLIDDAAVGRPRIETMLRRLRALNPTVDYIGLPLNAAPENADSLVAQADIVVDAAPLFSERFALNAACVRQRKAMIECALFECEGNVTTIVPGETPCLACLYPEDPPAWRRKFPVLSAVSGVIGSLGAMEVIKRITGLGESLAGTLLIADLAAMSFQRIEIQRRPNCPVCGHL